MSQSNGDARHPATQARLQTARADGDVARSSQLAGALHLLGVVLIAWLFLGGLGKVLLAQTETWWLNSTITAGEYRPGAWVGESLKSVGPVMLGLLVLLGLLAVAAHVIQTGPMFLPGRVSPDAKRMAPGGWMQKVFSPSNLVAAILDLPKVVLILLAAGLATWANLDSLIALGALPVPLLVQQVGELGLRISLQTALILLSIGLLDWGLNAWFRQRRLRMTDQELREELRQQHGNVHRIPTRR